MKQLRQDNSETWSLIPAALRESLVDDVLQLLNVWSGINGRCNSPTQRGYDLYGAVGIKLCSEWSSRQGQIRFVKWAISNGYRHGLVIDRKNGKKGYSPANCRVVTQKENSQNKSNNVMLSYLSETKCSSAWGEDPRCAVSSEQFQQRIKAGWKIKRAVLTPYLKGPRKEKENGRKSKSRD